MDSKTFYDRILEDVSTFDKIMYDLEKMSQEAPNARIRTVADTAIANLKLAQQICAALQEANAGR
ncbi:hypothetical protein DQT32_03150 [Salmonella enterica subsp. enterica serovar Braenderup]|nr:hypothetical protein [Salmonella enterica subsp. enterica serovar Braenderup]